MLCVCVCRMRYMHIVTGGLIDIGIRARVTGRRCRSVVELTWPIQACAKQNCQRRAILFDFYSMQVYM